MVRPEPVFELPEKQVYCLNLGTDVIMITNPSDSYNYSWARNGVPLLQTTQNIDINKGGTYAVTATNPVTECTTTKVIRVSESQIPLFDSSDIQVFDLTGDGSNRIEIDNSEAALGIGAYEFSLNDGPFQDSPIFENVPPGIHTVSVQDKNGCVGIVRQDVSVIGYPNFFTPNNDSKNDRWQLIGVSSVFQPSSFVYIFDQHGRLLAEIAADGTGWDGTYNGSPLPADDYWFRTVLEDGRVFTGNFSLVR
jgi:gliding motility-associated-like protein